MIERTKQVGKKRIKEEDLIRFPPGQHVVIIKLLKIVSYLVWAVSTVDCPALLNTSVDLWESLKCEPGSMFCDSKSAIWAVPQSTKTGADSLEDLFHQLSLCGRWSEWRPWSGAGGSPSHHSKHWVFNEHSSGQIKTKSRLHHVLSWHWDSGNFLRHPPLHPHSNYHCGQDVEHCLESC